MRSWSRSRWLESFCEVARRKTRRTSAESNPTHLFRRMHQPQKSMPSSPTDTEAQDTDTTSNHSLYTDRKTQLLTLWHFPPVHRTSERRPLPRPHADIARPPPPPAPPPPPTASMESGFAVQRAKKFISQPQKPCGSCSPSGLKRLRGRALELGAGSIDGETTKRLAGVAQQVPRVREARVERLGMEWNGVCSWEVGKVGVLSLGQ